MKEKSVVTTKELFKGISVVQDAPLIKVLTIKAKFVDQMNSWWEGRELPFDKIQIVGHTEHFIIFRLEGKFSKIAKAQFMDKIATSIKLDPNIPDDKKTWEAAEAKIAEVMFNIPQMFTD